MDGYKLSKSLALVLDEATDLDFANALVDIAGFLRMFFLKKNLARDIEIMIVGTGLERLSVPIVGCGTDPSKAHVITLLTPYLQAVLENGAIEVHHVDGIGKGIFSRVLATNARMLFNGVLPILMDKKHTFGLHRLGERKTDRIGTLGSVRELMDFGARYYLTQNTVAKSKNNHRKYLDACFYYHLRAAETKLEETLLKHKVGEKFKVFQSLTIDPTLAGLESTIADIGLIRSDGRTSVALKLLALHGQSYPVFAGNVQSLEELTCCHLQRRLQIGGAVVAFHGALENAWPPASKKSNNNIGQGEINQLSGEMNEQTEVNFSNRVRRLLAGNNEKFGIVFMQGKLDSQGPDVFELEVSTCTGTGENNNNDDDDDDNNKNNNNNEEKSFTGKLYVYQCKNTKTMDWKHSWSSLGVEQGDNAFEPNPDAGSAGYSFAGIKALRAKLNEISNSLNVTLGDRVVVSTKNGGNMHVVRQKEHPGCCKILPRELLEPTISALAYGESETAE